jgi:hypothetical protein
MAQCQKCDAYFRKYRCSAASHGECDCPRCQGYCRCEDAPEQKYTVSIWEERDRLLIIIYDENGVNVADWWDEGAREMFEDGFFERGKNLEKSVLAYAREMEII